jgi:hypothetical protein
LKTTAEGFGWSKGEPGTESERRMLDELKDQYFSLKTNGNGACGLHAAFGLIERGEFFCHDARATAVGALRNGRQRLRTAVKT